MIAKRKGLCLGLLLSLLSIGNGTRAYKLTIKNDIGYETKFSVKYHGGFFCLTDTKKLASGGNTKLSSGACTVKEVVALVYLPEKKYTPKWVFAKSYKAPWGRAGNSTFVVSKAGSGFEVRRKK